MKELDRALNILRRKNGEHELAGIKALDRVAIAKQITFSSGWANSSNYLLRQYHAEVRDALTELVQALDTKVAS